MDLKTEEEKALADIQSCVGDASSLGGLA